MNEETLLTAARRVVRFFNIDMNGGGLMTVDTQQAVETLDKYVRIESEKDKPMQITITKKEALAILELKRIVKNSATPPSEFLNWIADRLVHKNHDEENVDFVQRLRQYATLFRVIEDHLCPA